MTAASLHVTYDTRDTMPELRQICRDAGDHDFQKGGRDGEEKPGRWPCKICGTVKTVREALRP